jgi:hypothetical protein
MFITQCLMYFEARPSQFPSEKSKILFSASFLRGEAFSWYEATVVIPSFSFPSFDAYASKLRLTFGEDPLVIKDRVFQDLMALSQKGSVQKYTTSFVQLIARLSLDEATKISIFRRGLKPSIQRFLLSIPDQLLNLDTVITAATRYDDNLFALERSVPASSTTPALRQVTGRAPFPNEAPRAVAAQVRPAGTRLSLQERAQRVAAGLCVYCGKEGCPGAANVDNCAILVRRAGNARAGQNA